jgi:hypothetical protein
MRTDVRLVVRCDTLEAADGDRLGLRGVRFLDAATSARRLARAIASAAENSGEDVGLPIDEIGFAVAACCNQSYVFGDGGMGGTRPLAIDDFVEIVGLLNISRLQSILRSAQNVSLALVDWTCRLPEPRAITFYGACPGNATLLTRW